jgi:hypothetical protein
MSSVCFGLVKPVFVLLFRDVEPYSERSSPQCVRVDTQVDHVNEDGRRDLTLLDSSSARLHLSHPLIDNTSSKLITPQLAAGWFQPSVG